MSASEIPLLICTGQIVLRNTMGLPLWKRSCVEAKK